MLHIDCLYIYNQSDSVSVFVASKLYKITHLVTEFGLHDWCVVSYLYHLYMYVLYPVGDINWENCIDALWWWVILEMFIYTLYVDVISSSLRVSINDEQI